MNKISKKIVALVTMAAFVLSLAPAAAFADSTAINAANSTVAVEKNAKAYVGDAEGEVVTLTLKDASGTAVTEASNTLYVWFETTDGQMLDTVSYTGGETAVLDNGYAAKLTGSNLTVSATFAKAGEYVVKAGVLLDDSTTSTRSALRMLQNVDNQSNVVVTNRATEVTKIQLNNAESEPEQTDSTGTIKYDAAANGIDSKEVAFTVTSAYTDGTSGTPEVDQVITIENNNEGKGLYVLDADGNVADEITTDGNNGVFYLKAMKGYNYAESYIYLKSGDYKYKMTVKYDVDTDTTAATIEAVEGLEGLVDVDGDTAAQNADLAKVAQFIIKNAAGEKLSTLAQVDSKDEPALVGDLKYVTVKNQPEGEDFDGEDFKIEYKSDYDAWALQLNDSVELVKGDYTVEVALLSGDKAEVSFTVDEFGTVKSLEIDGSDTIEYTNDSDSVGEVYTVYAIDEKGMKKALTNDTDYTIGLVGSNTALATVDGTTLKLASADENNIGKTVELYVIGKGDYKMTASKEVTIVDVAVASTFAFDSDNGVANKNNTVEVSLVDQNGDVVSTGNLASLNVQGYVVSSSNEDANVDVNLPITLSAGKADLTIFSDKETKLEILVYGTAADGKLYANTLTYTVGDEETPDIPVNTTIAMTIGSNDFVVNNSIVNVEDAAPYIANDRTYVPFRALGEALGAEVVWDNDARTVTYTLGDTEIVMTIGETTYTVNGEEKTMDVAPEITGDRTYVPVRFVGEALGFKVTALSASDGTTAAVVFQK